MRPPLFSFALATALTLACGKTGPQGPTGPTGPTGPSTINTRIASYCNEVLAPATATNSWTLSVSCNAIADIPVEGWCYEPASLPSGAFLANDAPLNWNDTTKIAGWTCTWGWDMGATTSPIAADIQICCATPQ